MKKGQLNRLRALLLLLLISGGLLTVGCDGTESREKVNDTVETVAGKKDLEHYQQMKENLNDIQSKEAERYRQLDQNPKQE